MAANASSFPLFDPVRERESLKAANRPSLPEFLSRPPDACRPEALGLPRYFYTAQRDVQAFSMHRGALPGRAVIIAPGEEVSRPRFHGTFATHGARHSPPGHVIDGAADAAAAARYTQVWRALVPLGVNPAVRLGRARLNQRPAACN